jgi:predicted nuclease with TOPRIM domain
VTTLFRSTRQILENRLEVLRREKHHLDRKITVTEAKVVDEKQRYDSLASHWQSIGPAAVLTDAEREAARRIGYLAFWRGLAVGGALPVAVGLLLLLVL